MWHMTCDIWREVNILWKCQIPSLYSFEVKEFEYLEEKDHLLTELMN